MRRMIKLGKKMLVWMFAAFVLSGCSANTDSEPEATRSESEEVYEGNETNGENETNEESLEAGKESESEIESEIETESEAEDEKENETENETEDETEREEIETDIEDETEENIEEKADPSEKRDDILSSRLTMKELDLSASLRPEVSSVSVRGKFTGTPSIKNVYNIDVLSSELVGLFGCPVEVEFEGDSAVLTFTIDEEQAGDVSADDLVVLLLSEDRTEFLELDSSKSENTISVKIDTCGTYMLADMFIWYSVWGVDMSDYAHDTLYRDMEFGFSINVAKYVAYGTVSGYWETEDQGGCDLMVKSLIRQTNSDSTDMKLNMMAVRYPTEDESDSPMAVMELSENVEGIYNAMLAYSDLEVSPLETVFLDGEECGYIMCVHVLGDKDAGISEQYSITGYFYISDDTFLNITYSFLGNSEELKESALNSLRSFKYYIE